MTGIRRTSSGESVNVLVEAYHNIADGEVARVDFDVSVNGGASATTSVSSRAIWYPDDTDNTDPLPGTWGSGPAPLWCFGITISMADYAAGYITIVPTVVATSGESVTLNTIILYNDKDGTDRRPTTKVIYWDYVGGSDSNTGLSSGDAVQTFQKACELVATSNDCGGGIIYIDGEGTHYLSTYSAYAYGSNLYTSGHHWLTIQPRTGLTGSNVILVRPDNNDANWMVFAGTSTNQEARLRFRNLKVIGPGAPVTSGSNITMSVWLDGVELSPPSPFDISPGANGIYIRAYDYNGGPITINNLGPAGTRYATACHAHHMIFPNLGHNTRGCKINDCPSVMIQANSNNEAHTNFYIKDIYQNYGVSGVFPAVGGTDIRIEYISGQTYRIQAKDTYTDFDFAWAASYITGSTSLGIYLTNWSSNTTQTVKPIDWGYSGGHPYIEVTGTLTPENGVSSTRIEPGSFAGPYPWTTLVHSDIFQFNGAVSNIILSNIATFNAPQTQGIYDGGYALSGVAIINFYDGRVLNTGSIRSYLVGTLENILIRNSTFGGQFEADSTATLNTIEYIDNVYSGFTAYAGTTSAFASNPEVVMNYNHFIEPTYAVGSNTTNGLFYASATPSISQSAVASASSTAYHSASSTWNRPTNWYSGDRGAWLNVALGDWSYSSGDTLILSPNPISGTTSIPTQISMVVHTGAQLNCVTTIPDPSIVASFALGNNNSKISNNVTPVYSVTSFALVDNTTPIIGISVSTATTTVGTSTVINLNSRVTPRLTLSITTPHVVATNNPVIGTNPTDPTGTNPIGSGTTTGTTGTTGGEAEPGNGGGTGGGVIIIGSGGPVNVELGPRTIGVNSITNRKAGSLDENFVTSSHTDYDTNNLLPVMEELVRVNNNISLTSDQSKKVWSQTVLNNIEKRQSNTEVLKTSLFNYQKFNKVAKGRAGKIIPNRRAF